MRLRLYSVSGPAFRLRSLQNADMVNNPAKKVLRLLGEDGKQLCSGTRYLPEDCLLELTRIPRAWNKNFQAVLATDSGGGKCAALECILCVRSHNLAFQSHIWQHERPHATVHLHQAQPASARWQQGLAYAVGRRGQERPGQKKTKS